jgi:hypothetical protein
VKLQLPFASAVTVPKVAVPSLMVTTALAVDVPINLGVTSFVEALFTKSTAEIPLSF